MQLNSPRLARQQPWLHHRACLPFERGRSACAAGECQLRSAPVQPTAASATSSGGGVKAQIVNGTRESAPLGACTLSSTHAAWLLCSHLSARSSCAAGFSKGRGRRGRRVASWQASEPSYAPEGVLP